MHRKKIFVSFDFEHDRSYKYTLDMWNSNSSFCFTYDDCSSKEIQTENVCVVKQVLSRKINESNAVVVIVGKYANSAHPDKNKIGYLNWQNYEVAKAKEYGKKLYAIQLNSCFEYPEQLKLTSATRIYSFTYSAIVEAIRGK